LALLHPANNYDWADLRINAGGAQVRGAAGERMRRDRSTDAVERRAARAASPGEAICSESPAWQVRAGVTSDTLAGARGQ